MSMTKHDRGVWMVRSTTPALHLRQQVIETWLSELGVLVEGVDITIIEGERFSKMFRTYALSSKSKIYH